MKKYVNHYSSLFLVVIISIPGLSQLSKQDKRAAKEAMIKNWVESKKYVFVASTVLPTGGRSRQLTPTYSMIIIEDTVIANLPFFGRVYSATPGSAGGGIDFTSTKSEYISKPAKKGGWDIVIKPKDIKDIRQITLFISSAGNTTVTIISNNRQSISYFGYIEERKIKL